jgi:hypothetical protein
MGGWNCTPHLVNPSANLSSKFKSQHMFVMKPNFNLGFLENLTPVTLNMVTLKSYNPTMTRIVEPILVQLIFQGC